VVGDQAVDQLGGLGWPGEARGGEEQRGDAVDQHPEADGYLE
jgi:hypothetical protein